ncbi:MAG: heparinase II/III family protein [Verrucomicrobiota bacterium JB024]|nr:heparinase II/III family protein [Verrucomicrobiota bacterium JB024]
MISGFPLFFRTHCCGLALLALAAQGVGASAQEAADPVMTEATAPDLRTLLLKAQAEPATDEARAGLIEEARRIVDSGIVRRAYSEEELSQVRVSGNLSSASTVADPVIREQFLLASSDSQAGSVVAVEMPKVAAAYVLTQDPAFLAYLTEQLEEMTTWEPFQRPGWTLRSKSARGETLSERGDGVWLATGWDIRAVADTLEILPPHSLSPELRAKLDARIENSMTRILADFEEGVPWYVQSRKVMSNQWVVPVEGLIRATVFLGRDQYPEAYEQGVQWMLESLDAMGDEGEFSEGLSYASITVRGMISAARAAHVAGDSRLYEHPFMRKTGTWFAHHAQPGGFVVNDFDAFNTDRHGFKVYGDVLSKIAVFTGNSDAYWAVQAFDMNTSSLDAILAAAAFGSDLPAAPLWANYPVGTRLNWRSSWDDDATGVWIRGGGASDYHDHPDRGHVNFIIGETPLLIEAGRPPYGSPVEKIATGLKGHNVLQIGANLPADPKPYRRVAPITVNEIGPDGGDVTVDASACYPHAERWVRRVIWDTEEMEIVDEVVLSQPEMVVFYWNTGTPAGAPQHLDDDTAQAGPVRLEFEPDAPIEILFESVPDATLHRREVGEHVCVQTRTREPVTSFTLHTFVSLADLPVVDGTVSRIDRVESTAQPD